MIRGDFHKLHPQQFENACAEAHGTIAGWMLGHGIDPPLLTDLLIQAYRGAFEVAFNAGYAAAVQELQDRPR